MKIAMMSGALVNAGDFLIGNRSRALFEKFIPNAEVSTFKTNIDYNNRVDELNEHDLVVFAGGPYSLHEYSRHVPFVSDLTRLKTPVVIMGQGWYGKTALEKELYHRFFCERTKEVFCFIAQNDVPIGCRDWQSVRFLKNQGYHNTLMTGCPAWYDLSHIDDLCVNERIACEGIQRICISDMGRWVPVAVPYMKALAVYLRKKYPKASICMVFHRLLEGKEELVEQGFLEKYGLEYADITGNVEGFSVYDDCSLHIGFRVHAHIYNLSRGNVSILINEDARGAGVNDALGIQNITLREFYEISETEMLPSGTDDFIKTIDDYLQYIFNSDFLQYRNACSNIQFYYKKMQKFIKQIEVLALSR